LLVRPTAENADRVLRALSEFGFGKMGIQGIATRFIGLPALLRNKEQTGRAKDLGDAEELRKRTGQDG
jgi:hypothetical protein